MANHPLMVSRKEIMQFADSRRDRGLHDAQPGRMTANRSMGDVTMRSDRVDTSLPQKVGYPLSEDFAKLLKNWSGRRDSNPRRPAWEYERRL